MLNQHTTNTSGVIHWIPANWDHWSAVFPASLIDVMDCDVEGRTSREEAPILSQLRNWCSTLAALMPPYSSSWHAYLQQRTSEAPDYARAAGQTLVLSPELHSGVALLNLASANMLGANRTNNREKASVLEDLSQRHTRSLLSIPSTLCHP
jgi:hypothetical protein